MARWLDEIKQKNMYKRALPASDEAIAEAERKLGVSFAADYREFLSSIGACICFGHEIKGIADLKEYDVVRSTEEIRSLIDLVPHSWYVIEDTHMDGIVILQDKNGTIYQMSALNAPMVIADSLESYIFDEWNGDGTNSKEQFIEGTKASATLNETAQRVLNASFAEAKRTIENPDQVEKILQQMEKKLEKIPGVGDWLADVPAVISLVRSYIKNEYKEVPVGSIIAAIAAILYIISPVDLVPDFIPGAGMLDDAAIFVGCWKMIHDDVDAYQAWRKQNGKAI